MINHLYKYFTLVVITLCFRGVSEAAVPAWTVNPSEYEFSMTVTAVLNMDGAISVDKGDMVGAFIDGVCHGVASPSTYTTADGYKIVFLQVYSNTILGETVSFELYDASSDVLTTAVNSLTFQNDGSTGTTSIPYIITTNQNPTDLNLAAVEIMEGKTIGSEIGDFVVTDPDLGASSDYTYTLVPGAADNANFSISGGKLVSAVVFDNDVKSSYTILVEVSDGKGGTFQKELTVYVTVDPDEFYASNYISPNEDGKNDVWEIKNVDVYKDYKIKIYNDAGIVVYSTTGYNNDWKGTYEGKNLPTGVYYFLIQSPDDARKFTGSISLNR